jgi:hypothetical protein
MGISKYRIILQRPYHRIHHNPGPAKGRLLHRQGH